MGLFGISRVYRHLCDAALTVVEPSGRDFRSRWERRYSPRALLFVVAGGGGGLYGDLAGAWGRLQATAPSSYRHHIFVAHDIRNGYAHGRARSGAE